MSEHETEVPGVEVTDEPLAGTGGSVNAETGEVTAPGERLGALAGTASELAPGVGGGGEHPAPAVMADEDGLLHQAGEPVGTASGQAPVGDSTDLQAGDVTDPEALEKLNAVAEPDPYPIDRPDLGTE